jgi:hypothetical protein
MPRLYNEEDLDKLVSCEPVTIQQECMEAEEYPLLGAAT